MIDNFLVDNVSFSYDKDLVLKDITYKFNIDEITVILGLNGCGKTTLLKILTNILKKYQGSIRIDDKILNEISPLELSKLISFVPQLTDDSNDFKVMDFLTFGLVNSIKFYSRPKKEQIKKVIDVADELGLKKLLDKNMNEISGGEKQMVLICAAVIQNTQVIILDEPVSALDLNNQYKVLNLLKKLKEDGKTIILTSHNPNICLYLNSDVVLLHEHKLYRSGKAKDVITIDNIKNIYGDNLISYQDANYDGITFK